MGDWLAVPSCWPLSTPNRGNLASEKSDYRHRKGYWSLIKEMLCLRHHQKKSELTYKAGIPNHAN